MLHLPSSSLKDFRGTLLQFVALKADFVWRSFLVSKKVPLPFLYYRCYYNESTPADLRGKPSRYLQRIGRILYGSHLRTPQGPWFPYAVAIGRCHGFIPTDCFRKCTEHWATQWCSGTHKSTSTDIRNCNKG